MRRYYGSNGFDHYYTGSGVLFNWCLGGEDFWTVETVASGVLYPGLDM